MTFQPTWQKVKIPSFFYGMAQVGGLISAFWSVLLYTLLTMDKQIAV